MPIDYSIPAKFGQLGIIQSTLASLREQTARQESLRSEQAKQATLASLLPNAINQDGSLNQSIVTQMAAIDPDAAIRVGKLRDMQFPQFSQGAVSPTKLPTVDDQGNPVTRLVYPGGRVEDYRLPPEPTKAPARSTYKKDGFEITEEFDPASGKYKEIARSKIQGQEEKGRQFDVNTELKLSDDYRADSKDFATIKRQYAIIKKSLNNPSAVGTLASATAIMKMLDPGSVVRESELGMAMQATGAIDRLYNFMNVVESGKVLTADQKKEFGALVDQFYEASQEAQRSINKSYRDKADSYGLNWRNIVTFDAGWPKLPGEITVGADRVNPSMRQPTKGNARPPMVRMK